MTARTPILVALVSLPLVLGGCLEDPYTGEGRPPRDSSVLDEDVRRAQARGDELAPRVVARPSAPTYTGVSAPRNAQETLRAFCAQWANWSYRTIERQQRRLAELATPGLAREVAPSASQRSLDTTLERDRFAVQGTVVAIDMGPGRDRRRALCVTREEEIDQGRDPLGDGVHRVYSARLERTDRLWEVAAWQPQP